MIPLKIGFYAFYLSQLIFKFGYTIDERRLLLLTGECNSGCIHELCVNLVDCGNKLVVISQAVRSFDQFA